MKKTTVIIIVIILILVAGGIYYMTRPAPTTVNNTTTTPQVVAPDNTATTTANQPTHATTTTVLGKSVEGRDIMAYHYGTGSKEILLVGGIHGGYEWNTALVAYQIMDYLVANPSVIPSNIKVTVIPVLNPDGLNKVVGTTGKFSSSDVSSDQKVVVAGRLNANNVDLNRNFDCDWKSNAVWQSKPVSGGASAFSEPESKAFKDYVEASKPTAVVAWYSAAGGVFASNCHDTVSAETSALTKLYASASGYPAHQSYDFYAITGDMVNWLAKNNIPGISVLLTNHTDTELSKNEAGINAVLKQYAQ
jgi:g-D-glutamyl-meso-diaminopimelate peptidase